MARALRDVVGRYLRHFERLGIQHAPKLSPKQVQAALRTYVAQADHEVPVVVFDTSLLGGGSQGVMLTHTSLYSRGWRGPVRAVRYEEIKSVSCEVRRAGGAIAWCDFSINDRKLVRVYGRRRTRGLYVLSDVLREVAGLGTSSLSTGWWPVPTGQH